MITPQLVADLPILLQVSNQQSVADIPTQLLAIIQQSGVGYVTLIVPWRDSSVREPATQLILVLPMVATPVVHP